jgi:hypothetical protein
MIVATCYVCLEMEVKVTVTVSKNKRKKHYMIVTSRNLVCLKRACSNRQDQTGRLDSQPKHDQCKIFFSLLCLNNCFKTLAQRSNLQVGFQAMSCEVHSVNPTLS